MPCLLLRTGKYSNLKEKCLGTLSLCTRCGTSTVTATNSFSGGAIDAPVFASGVAVGLLTRGFVLDALREQHPPFHQPLQAGSMQIIRVHTLKAQVMGMVQPAKGTCTP
mmetsp:Transcript_91023/g.190366  ORF Transcript_91023/g.190366 Transcript_91023/m.190366 type:complete len:109 (-) Transcript_91023:199-525(-)